MSAEIDCMLTVLGAKSRDGCLRSFGGYREVLNSVFTSVDFPRPDSPANLVNVPSSKSMSDCYFLTNDHNVEVEAFSHTLAVPLVWQVREPNIASKLPAHDVPHISGCLCCRFRVF